MRVVSIAVTKVSIHGETTAGVGSRFIFGKKGHIITNNHVVNDAEFLVGGYIILSMDGNDVRKIDDVLTNLQREKPVGNKLILGILKDGQMTDVTHA